MQVLLAARKANSSRKHPTAPADQWTEVATLAAASDACRQFIDAYDLGASEWAGGVVTQGAVAIARISYNGRVWPENGG
ncbi:MAG: hypothetical protein ACYCOR_17945 [Acidobacteriaceae bacterium]